MSHATQNVSQAGNTTEIHPEVLDYIQDAIKDGSMLGIDDNINNIPPAARRALIVAPLYNNHVEIDTGSRWVMLKSTATDAKLIHEMLVGRGYDRSNIRVLSDVCGGFLGLADPTKENILRSLEWLTANVQAGDYRFFHFSGHGERMLREKDQGKAKQARRVITDSPEKPPEASTDTERDSKFNAAAERIKELVTPIKDLAYYNEGIVTRISELRSGDSGLASRIMDSELNNAFSKLPAGSVLTCVIDCCASGRIVYCNTKALGPGFRGTANHPVNIRPPPMKHDQERNPPRNDPPLVQKPPNQPVLQTQPVSSIGSLEEHKNILEIFKAEESSKSHHIGKMPGGLENMEHEEQFFDIVEKQSQTLVPAGFIRMPEEIPIEERQMDHIKAKTFVWTGCHQRQDAWGYDDQEPYGWGIFTKAFTEAFSHISNDQASGVLHTDYNALFTTISRAVTEETRKIGILQFAQLWTSLQNIDEEKLRFLLAEPVVI